MIKSLTLNHGRNIDFYDESDSLDSENIYTIIVGKNGTGKSRLIAGVVNEMLRNTMPPRFLSAHRSRMYPRLEGTLSISSLPKNIITVSTSPFDRFLVAKKQENFEGYSYLGLRDLMSQNFGLAYLSKVVASLVESILDSTKQVGDISSVLNYLGYTDLIIIHFNTRASLRGMDKILDAPDPVNEFIANLRVSRSIINPINKGFFFDGDEVLVDRVYHFFDIIKRVLSLRLPNFVEVAINRHGVHSGSLFQEYLYDILFLMKAGVFRLKDVILQRKDDWSSYSINDASSGEQSVVIGILGIASQISDNSLVCIDEPEICLHPEWQEKYIKLLISTFRNYKGCHFIIATHSPQIIAKLESYNCYVLKLESGKVTNAKELNNHSVDYQLATVFDTPGYKNEYLSRIALSILSKVAKSKMFDEEDLNGYELLRKQSENMEKEDPLINLISIITELKKDLNKKNA